MLALAEQSRPAADAVRQATQLAEIRGLLEPIAGFAATGGTDHDAIRAAYDAALPIVRKQFDALTAEAANWAATGIDALLGGGDPPRAAAARLAQELAATEAKLIRLLRL